MVSDTELVTNIFSKQIVFEKEVLNVRSQKDKKDIIHILSDLMVRDILKEHINFLYIKNLSDFSLKHIVNILFKELASEWVSFAIEELHYSKEKALDVLQDRDKVKFIHSIADDYYKHYKSYIFEEIADTFIELLASIKQTSKKIILVNAVINSNLIVTRSVLNINSFDQLYLKIVAAKKLKSKEITTLQLRVSDILIELDCNSTTNERRETLLRVLSITEEKNKKLMNKKLEYFDESLQRVKRSIFNSLKSGIYE